LPPRRKTGTSAGQRAVQYRQHQRISFPASPREKHFSAAPVTAFIATVSKGAIFALLLRYFYSAAALHFRPVFVLFAIIAIASMLIGNLLALLQNNVKRILAYASIAHMGYLLVAFEASSATASEAVTFYLVAYFITTVGAFGVVTVLSDEERDADTLDVTTPAFSDADLCWQAFLRLCC